MMSHADLYLGASGPLISSTCGSREGGGAPESCVVFGVPFDATHSYRPGCRFGPDAIRTAFNNIEVFHPELGADLESVCIRDMGNIPHTASAAHMVDVTRRVTEDLLGRGLPIFALGGEHLMTYGTYTAFPRNVAYVVFDAHYDLRDEYGDVRLNHATYLRRVAEERGADAMLHVGARASAAEEMAYLCEHRIRAISDSDVRKGMGPEMLCDFASSFDAVYASFDLDVIDPGFAPGVGNPEAEGMMPRELFDMVRGMMPACSGGGNDDGNPRQGDITIAGADIVELNPAYDTGATASLAAKILSMLIASSTRR